ncbi:MAG: hypothetical protein ACFCUH_12585 [Flavobacteriales bacterium]
MNTNPASIPKEKNAFNSVVENIRARRARAKSALPAEQLIQGKRHLKTLYPPIVIAAGQATGNRTDEAFTTSNEHEKSPESH